MTLICEDYGDWIISHGRIRHYEIEAGLTDEQGRPALLTVQLTFQTDGKKKRSFVFSLMKRDPDGLERVYQLAVNQGEQPTDTHRRTHEHWGDRRADLPEEMNRYSFDELLRYFCSRTNLTFRPNPIDPTFIGRKR